MKLLQTLFIIALSVAIGAFAGLLTSDLRPDGAAAGAVIGLIIGSWLSMRVAMHRSAIRTELADPAAMLHEQEQRDRLRSHKRPWLRQEARGVIDYGEAQDFNSNS